MKKSSWSADGSGNRSLRVRFAGLLEVSNLSIKLIQAYEIDKVFNV